MQFVKALTELNRTDLPLAGGKGANLGALLQAGLPVPSGFCITTAGYRSFVANNQLEAELRRILAATQMDDPSALESAAEQIRAGFRAGQIPPALADEIRRSYAALADSSPAVAVRSSATAEDLPDLSFAGQQDTYLNIVGEAAVLDAAVHCWASLWTARAMGYRARNHIAPDGIALAVVIQCLVPSEASGVLFTVNPLTGKRSETVIDATFGLGEALVSGQVEPDHYVVENTGHILSKTLGAKALVIQGQTGGGTVTVAQAGAGRQALPDEQILALTRLGQQAAAYFGSPQDMEWAWANGRMYVVQSRPVTSLYPLPANVAAEPLEVLYSFGTWQGMLDPYTPLGQDMLTGVIAGGEKAFGYQPTAEQRVLLCAGERLFVNLTGLLTMTLGRKLLGIFLPAIDPDSHTILNQVLKEYAWPAPQPVGLRTTLHLARGLLPILYGVIYNLLRPARGRLRLHRKIEQVLADIQARCTAARDLPELVEAIISTTRNTSPQLLPYLLPGVIAGQMPLQILLRLMQAIPNGPELVMELTRGLPYNVTTEMDLALWQTAQAIRNDAAATTCFSETTAAALAAAYQAARLPAAAQTALAAFLARYGMRGVGEIDLGRPRWNDDPTHVIQVIQSYLKIDPANSPEITFQRGVEKARQAQAQLVAACRQRPGGGFKVRLVKLLTPRVRELGGLRETPKFMVVRLLGHIRTAVLNLGRQLVAAGQLNRADDVFYLHLPELRALGRAEPRDWAALIAERRATYARELRRKNLPRILLSNGVTFYSAPDAGAAEPANSLSGSPVSAGVVEGTAHVIIDPHGAQLAPGEILVCPATDPAWTPLFLAAGGLVMEVGGMMTHGSVVAREYGIPAVVGVRQATTRLQTGQRLRVDGSTGKVVIL